VTKRATNLGSSPSSALPKTSPKKRRKSVEKLEFGEIQSAEKAKLHFKEVIDTMKRVAQQMMKTRAGRDGLRRDLGCAIEGFDEENKEWFGNHPWENHK